MSYDPPKGRELKILKKFKKLDKLSFNAYSIKSPSIACTYGHAVEGVRTNGHEHLTSLSSYRYEWLREMKETKEDLQDWIKNYKKVIEMHKQFETEIEKYFWTCGKCNGKGGRKRYPTKSADTQTKWNNIPIWDDCEPCNGRGLIEK